MGVPQNSLQNAQIVFHTKRFSVFAKFALQNYNFCYCAICVCESIVLKFIILSLRTIFSQDAQTKVIFEFAQSLSVIRFQK